MDEKFNYFIQIECSDKADSLALRERLIHYLEILDNGDYCGREVKIIGMVK